MAPESPSGGRARGGFDLSTVNRNDLGVMIAGVVAFIASFLPYWGVSAGPYHASVTAWHSYAILGLLLVFAAAIVIAVVTFASGSMPRLPIGVHLAAAVAAAIGTLLLILRAFTYPHASFSGGSYGAKWGAYVLFVAGIAEVVFAVLGMREAGEKVAWQTGGGSASPTAPPA